MISVQKDGVKFSVVTGSAKEARLRRVLVSILGQSFSDDGAGVHGERSFLYRPLDLDLLEGLDTTRAQFFGKKATISVFRGNEGVNASDGSQRLGRARQLSASGAADERSRRISIGVIHQGFDQVTQLLGCELIALEAGRQFTLAINNDGLQGMGEHGFVRPIHHAEPPAQLPDVGGVPRQEVP